MSLIKVKMVTVTLTVTSIFALAIPFNRYMHKVTLKVFLNSMVQI